MMPTVQADEALLSSVLSKRSAQLEKKREGRCQHLLDFPLQPTVQLGTASGEYTYNVSGSFTCYASSEYESGALHTVLVGRISPLHPASTYFYRTGDPKYGWGREHNFTMPAPVSQHSTPYRCTHCQSLL